jgi:hypothetical protein
LFTEAPVSDERQTASTPRDFARPPAEYRLVPCDRDDSRRKQAEAFIRQRFRQSHGAQIATFLPSLLLLTDGDDGIAAVTGFRCAAREPLFLERYLSAPIEAELSSHTAEPVRRAQIIEVGNFAAIDSRRAKILMSFLPAYLLGQSARWIAFTATTAIRAMLSTAGARCLDLGAADHEHVAGGVDQWGRYYSNDPRVMAGYLPSARRIPALWRPHHGY